MGPLLVTTCPTGDPQLFPVKRADHRETSRHRACGGSGACGGCDRGGSGACGGCDRGGSGACGGRCLRCRGCLGRSGVGSTGTGRNEHGQDQERGCAPSHGRSLSRRSAAVLSDGPDLLVSCTPPGERHQTRNRGIRPLGTLDFRAPSGVRGSPCANGLSVLCSSSQQPVHQWRRPSTSREAVRIRSSLQDSTSMAGRPALNPTKIGWPVHGMALYHSMNRPDSAEA